VATLPAIEASPRYGHGYYGIAVATPCEVNGTVWTARQIAVNGSIVSRFDKDSA